MKQKLIELWIDENNKKMGYETRTIIAFQDRAPKKDELIALANGGESK